jgi:hypothetical protein
MDRLGHPRHPRLLQQPAFTGQLQPFGPGSVYQHRDQLVIRRGLAQTSGRSLTLAQLLTGRA